MEQQRLGLIGNSAAMCTLDQQVDDAARATAKVLITGESGVGKEIVAQLIHRRSSRATGPLVTINCAGIPDSLLESEMFGHVKGSFTDAYRDKRGWLETAHGGTIFMDEVGEMSLRMQALLLRFLENGEIQRVGSERMSPPVDVRVIAATHRPLLQRVQEQTFRQDLYYRLNVIHLEIPALRDRPDDMPALLAYFLDVFSRTYARPVPEISSDALIALLAYPWPGNVRELRNACERLVIGSHTGLIGLVHLPAEIRRAGHSPAVPSASRSAAAPSPSELLYRQLTSSRVSFWSAVYEPFMARDVTRDELRDVIRLGLEHTHGNYKTLVTLFNMPVAHYKRFVNFLRKHECHVAPSAFGRASLASRSLGQDVSDQVVLGGDAHVNSSA